MPRNRAGELVLLSGGLDSALLLAQAESRDTPTEALHVTYGQQTAEIERRNADALADHYGIPLHTTDLSETLGQYAQGVTDGDESFTDQTRADGRSTGYVPMRNLTLLAIASGFADRHGLATVMHGAQQGDRDDYPDCRPSFMAAAQQAISESLPGADEIAVSAPLLDYDKPDVIREASERGVPLEFTYSCYSQADAYPNPCGHCPACLERTEAFEQVGIEDPITQ